MAKVWPFAKYVGCGNDFVLFDNRTGKFPLHPPLIQRLCHRHIGIGADGLILLESPTKTEADFYFRIFNSDGSEAEMCGNGMRCFVKWLTHLGIQRDLYHIQTMHNILTAKPIEQNICIEMGTPSNVQWDIPLHFENRSLSIHCINTGVPHAVLFVEDIEEIDMLKMGFYIRNHSLWAPQGVNVTFAEKKEGRKLKIRTYERGVEGETLACGTGATAAALAAAHHYHISSLVDVETRLGEELKIEFTYENQKFSKVTLTGSADRTFTGEIDLFDCF